MPITYNKCDDAVDDIVKSIREKHHPDLNSADVTVDCYFASEVKLNGYSCAAKIKLNSYAERVQGKPDATIFIDAEEWEHSMEPRREALIDHELNHLDVQWAGTDTAGNKVAKTDDLGRPKLKMRKHDFQVGWFHVIAERHGDASYEVKQAKAFADAHGQLYFGWKQPPGGSGVESMPAAMPPVVGESTVKTTAKMYECRDSYKSINGKDWQKKLEPAIAMIEEHAAAQDMTPLLAAKDLMEKAVDKVHGIAQGVAIMELTAAAVEIIEPTKETANFADELDDAMAAARAYAKENNLNAADLCRRVNSAHSSCKSRKIPFVAQAVIDAMKNRVGAFADLD